MSNSKKIGRKSIGLKVSHETYDAIVEKAGKQNRTINNFLETLVLKETGKEGLEL